MDSFKKFIEATESFAEDYYKGVPKDKKDDRKAHFKRYAEKPGDGADKDSNYKPAPGDFKDGERVKTKVSKHTKKYKQMYGEEMEISEDATAALKKKAEKTGMPLGVLRKVYNRGVAAWKSGHRPGTTPEQWGHARVNSFVTKSSGTWGKADKDLAAQVRKEEVELDEAKRKGAPKMQGDWLKKERERNREHDAAMGRTPTGRKKPVRQMTSTQRSLAQLRGESVDQVDEGILKPYHAIGKQPWSKTVKDSKGTAGEYKMIAKGKDFGVWYAYRGSNKSFPHYVVKDDKIIGSGMTVKSALKDAGIKEKDLTHRSKFADGSPLNKGMKEEVELYEVAQRPLHKGAIVKGKFGGKVTSGKVIDHEIVQNKAGVVVHWKSGEKGRFPNDHFDTKGHHKSMNEEVEQLDEGNMMSAAKELEAYARKFGGIDKNDFMKAATMMKKNQRKQLDKFVDELDTEPREKILSVMDKHLKEEVEQLDEFLPFAPAAAAALGTAARVAGRFIAKKLAKRALKKAATRSAIKTGAKAAVLGAPHALNRGERNQAESLDAQFEAFLDEKLKASDDMGTWVKDFQDSDAPQFKGKSKKKRQQMAVAAKLGAERDAGMREERDLDELSMSLKDLTKSGAGNVFKAMKADKTKKDLEALKKRLNDRERLNKEEHGAGDEGTDELVKKFKKDTPNAQF